MSNEYSKGFAVGKLTAMRGQQAATSFKWSRDYRYGYSDGYFKGSGAKPA